MSSRFERIVSAVLVACAVVATSTLVHREFFAEPLARRPESAVQVEGWSDLLARGVRTGQPGAPVQIVEFGDFQCPFCRTFHREIEKVLLRHGPNVAHTFVHFPLDDIHPSARDAALAAECAAEAGRFSELKAALFARQDQLGSVPWTVLARAAGIDDTLSYEECLVRPATASRVEDDIAIGQRLGVRGTPTVMVNGWMLPSPPTADSLSAMIERVLAGRDLFHRN